MITVCCCLWGEWPAYGWGEEYVARLKRAVERNLGLPHRFICFADNPERVPDGIEARPLKALSWKGCLPKLYVYSSEAGLEGRVLLFDLDNVIVGSLDDMAAYDGEYCVRAALPEWEQGKRVLDGDMIAFEPGEKTRALWDAFSADPQGVTKETGGRERWFIRSRVEADVWQETIPGQVVSFKAHCRKDGHKLPPDARVVSFHGNPRPHMKLELDWVQEHWR